MAIRYCCQAYDWDEGPQNERYAKFASEAEAIEWCDLQMAEGIHASCIYEEEYWCERDESGPYEVTKELRVRCAGSGDWDPWQVGADA